MTLYRPVDVTPGLELGPSPAAGPLGGRELARLKLRGEVEDLDREALEQLRAAVDEALS